jgi:hypothetical protein
MAVVAVAVLLSIRTSDHHVDPCFLVTGCPRSWLALVAAPAGDARSGMTPKLVVVSRRPLTHALSGVEVSRLQPVKTGLSPLASESPSPCILSHSHACKPKPPINLQTLTKSEMLRAFNALDQRSAAPLAPSSCQQTQAAHQSTDADNLEMLRAFNNLIHLLLKCHFWAHCAHCSTCCCNPCSIIASMLPS